MTHPLPALSRFFAWVARHERRLGAALFAFGFITDFFTFGLLPVQIVNYLFIAYLVLAAACVMGAHYFAGIGQGEKEVWWRKALAVMFPLGAQYAFGGLLSGLVVFYTAHSFVAASWPFILLLGVVYFGNEYFRMYKQYVVFQTTIFFFTLYAYLIFGLPLLVKSIGPWVFLGSTLLTAILFVGFLWLLKLAHKTRLMEVRKQIAVSSSTIVIAVCLSYFSGLIPPLPLVLADQGIYHGVHKMEDSYHVEAETKSPWWHIGPPVVHQTSGEFLYAFSAVSAPIQFGTTIVHRWEHNTSRGWETQSKISFPISGGREGGYRGYSAKQHLAEGKWRVSVETENGQTIGRIRFNVEKVDAPPEVYEEIL